jgi:DNA-directed RNA polymerase subunit M/transcription elongation factor TFIIS
LLSWDDDGDQEAKDRAFALQLEAQFKEESRAAAAAASEAEAAESHQGSQIDSQSLIQCPLCGNWIEAGDADLHVNSCLDGVLANELSAEEAANSAVNQAQPSSRRGQALSKDEKQHDPVTKEPFECPICTETIAAGSGYELPCHHPYCGECLAVR